MVEGPTLVAEAIAAGAELEAVFVAAGARQPAVAAVLEHAQAAGVETFELDPATLRRAVDVTSPQPIVAVARIPSTPFEEATAAHLVLVAVGIADPGNAGTLMRTAEAAGAGAVVFTDGSVDPYNPKCVRASAGSIFHVAVVVGGAVGAILDRLQAAGQLLVATAATGGVAYDEVDLTGPVAVVLGNEAHGLPVEVAGRVDRLVSIPMIGRSESLNVAMAGTVVCFEAGRQRRAAPVAR